MVDGGSNSAFRRTRSFDCARDHTFVGAPDRNMLADGESVNPTKSPSPCANTQGEGFGVRVSPAYFAVPICPWCAISPRRLSVKRAQTWLVRFCTSTDGTISTMS